MSLRFALLALLRVGPLSGYDLQKQFSVSVGHVWHAPGSQIYPELRKMEADGLVVAEEQTRGERGARRLYHVTPEGETAFAAWMRSPVGYHRVRDPAHLRAAYLEAVDAEAARSVLRAHEQRWQEELAQWEEEIARIDAGESPMLQRRLAVTAPPEQAATTAWKRFAYEGLVDRARTEIAWARRGLELVAELER